MPAMIRYQRLLASIASVCALCGGVAHAQSQVAPAWVTQGYNGAAASASSAVNADTRDASNNRIVINGEIQTPGMTSVQSQFAALSGGASGATAGAGSNTSTATAIGNLINVSVDGSWNTVIVNANQQNSGNISASTGTGQQQKVSNNAPQ